jgi:Flp pilus assembly protein TadD
LSHNYSSTAVRIRIGRGPVRPEPPAADEAVGSALAALDRGDLDSAGAIAAAALGSGCEHAVLRCILAMALQAAGRFEQALPHLTKAAALEPADVSIANALGRCLLCAERPAEAFLVLEKALRVQPFHAESHANRGQALERIGRLPEAERSYRMALELEPDQITAKAGMASLSNHYGDHGAARAYASAVLDAAPGHAPAALSLAMADLALGSPRTAEAHIRRMMQAPRPDAWLGSYLGDALDAQGRCEEAFQAWRTSGEALRSLHAPRISGAGELAAAERSAAQLESVPPGAWPRRDADSRGPVETHVFLMGFARSGTSLLGLALAGHRQVEMLDEQEPLQDALRRFSDAAGLNRLLDATEAQLDEFRTAYWRRVGTAGMRLDRKLFLDKQPMNSLHLPLIARLFPNARILFARRDPRDVVLSCFRRRFLMNRYTYELLTPEGAAGLYSAAMRLAHRTCELASPDILTVAHEDLVDDFEAEMVRICAFLGLGWSDSLATFAERVRSGGVATPSASQLAQGLNSKGVGRWRRYARELAPLAPLLDPWVERFGYGHGATERAPSLGDRTGLSA